MERTQLEELVVDAVARGAIEHEELIKRLPEYKHALHVKQNEVTMAPSVRSGNMGYGKHASMLVFHIACRAVYCCC